MTQTPSRPISDTYLFRSAGEVIQKPDLTTEQNFVECLNQKHLWNQIGFGSLTEFISAQLSTFKDSKANSSHVLPAYIHRLNTAQRKTCD